MGDLISRQAVIEAIDDDTRNGMYSCFASNNDAQCFKDVIRELPSVENKGEGRPKGHWIEKGYVGDGNYLFECSECHSTDTQKKDVKVDYCWHCGADMRGYRGSVHVDDMGRYDPLYR